jgi:hypothetical protein
MAKLGSEKRPLIVHVKTEERAHALPGVPDVGRGLRSRALFAMRWSGNLETAGRYSGKRAIYRSRHVESVAT